MPGPMLGAGQFGGSHFQSRMTGIRYTSSIIYPISEALKEILTALPLGNK